MNWWIATFPLSFLHKSKSYRISPKKEKIIWRLSTTIAVSWGEVNAKSHARVIEENPNLSATSIQIVLRWKFGLAILKPNYKMLKAGPVYQLTNMRLACPKYQFFFIKLAIPIMYVFPIFLNCVPCKTERKGKVFHKPTIKSNLSVWSSFISTSHTQSSRAIFLA